MSQVRALYPLNRPGPWPSVNLPHWRGNATGNFNFVNCRKTPAPFDINDPVSNAKRRIWYRPIT